MEVRPIYAVAAPARNSVHDGLMFGGGVYSDHDREIAGASNFFIINRRGVLILSGFA